MEEDQEQFQGGQAEPVRSRWTPRPDQILILESIFNSGMVNPPKDETVRIRKLLEKFGPVGDANVFYWFQNRRSRSRRKQRQIQAAAAADQPQSSAQLLQPNNVLHYDHSGNFSNYSTGSGSSFNFGPDGCDDGTASGHIMSFSGNPMQGFDQSSHFGNPETTSSFYNFQPEGIITVFINGVATEVGQQGYGLDIRAMFGGDFILCHSSGMPVVDLHTLTHGENYFLVPRHC